LLEVFDLKFYNHMYFLSTLIKFIAIYYNFEDYKKQLLVLQAINLYCFLVSNISYTEIAVLFFIFFWTTLYCSLSNT